MTKLVLIDAGRSAVVPDRPDIPEAPVDLAADVITGLLTRSKIERSEVSHLFLADPRCICSASAPHEPGWSFAPPPLDLTTTVSMSGANSLRRAIAAIQANPDTIAIVAATDTGSLDQSAGDDEAVGRRLRAIREVAARWQVHPDEMSEWAQSSYERAVECADAGDFADEIVASVSGYQYDRFHEVPPHGQPDVTAPSAHGASAIILAGEDRARRLGLRPRAHLRVSSARPPTAECGISPLSAEVIGDMLAPCRIGVERLDHLEVPEWHAVTPLAWLKETRMNRDLVNPRGSDLGFGHLPRSGHLRALVTMTNSLEATGGRAGAVVAASDQATTAFVLARSTH